MNVDLQGVTALVTGGTGFIGRYLVDALLERGATVTVLSRRKSTYHGHKYRTIVGDLTRPDTLEGVCQGVKIIFHLGGHAHAVDQSDDSSELLNRQVTVEGTQALLDQSIKAGVSGFLFFSSVKSMGEGGVACLDEMTDCQPVSAYGKAKREAEKLVLDACRHGMASTVLRLPMVYGPGCKGNIPRMIEAIARGRFPPLPETGNRRSMVDVRDVVQAALLSTLNPVAACKIYIVTDGQTYSTRQLYEWINDALGRSVPRWTVPLLLLRTAARMGDVIGRISGRRFMIDSDALEKLTGSACYRSERASRELGYRPCHSLRNSLPEIVTQTGVSE